MWPVGTFCEYCVPRIFVDTLGLQPSHLPLSRTQQWAPLSSQQPGCDAAAGDLCPQYRYWIAAAVIMAPQLSAHLRSEVRRILLETDWTTKPIHNLYIFRSGLQSMFRRFAFKISSKFLPPSIRRFKNKQY